MRQRISSDEDVIPGSPDWLDGTDQVFEIGDRHKRFSHSAAPSGNRETSARDECKSNG
jgi:hypothetical protein